MDTKEMRELLASHIGQWNWTRPKKRGRPSKTANMGQPRKMDAAALVIIEGVIQNGGSITQALKTAQISWEAWENWKQINPKYSERMEALKQFAINRAEHTLTEGLKYDAELALKYLERKKPKEYSLKESMVHSFDFTGIVLDRPKVIEQLPESSEQSIESIASLPAATENNEGV